MPFQQPELTTIRSHHFRDNQYTFPLKSVLEPGWPTGTLLVEASPGYGLKTPDNAIPQAQLVFNYTLQPDGSSLVQTTITLVSNGPLLTDSSVILSDPTGQVLRLQVLIRPMLTLSDSVLTFVKTQLTDTNEVNAVLKINQHGTRTPIELSTDDPHRFALAASGKHLHFTPALTISPAGADTYIYIRYRPERPGAHPAWLVVKTPYDTQKVSLQGFAGDRSDWYSSPGWFNGWRHWLNWSGQPITIRFQPARAVLLLLAGTVLYAAYAYRCQLVPQLCQVQSVRERVASHPDTIEVSTRDYSAAALEERFANRPDKKTDPDKRVFIRPFPEAAPAIVAEAPTRYTPKVSKQTKLLPRAAVKPRVVTVNRSVTPELDSDLEKILNQKPRDKFRPQLIKLPAIFESASRRGSSTGKSVEPIEGILIHN